jgi:F-type H+-transporting ATPase subunit b
MNINISLIGQMITFGVLIWFTMKFVWPPLIGAVDRRNKEIAEGLDAAAQGKQRLAEAKDRLKELVEQGRAKQQEHIADGKRQRTDIIAKATQEATVERDRIIAAGKKAVEQERATMVRELQDKCSDLVVAGASRILRREVDAKAHQDIVDELINKI